MHVEHVIEEVQHNEKVNNLPLFHSMKSIGEFGPVDFGHVLCGCRILAEIVHQALQRKGIIKKRNLQLFRLV
jgi:hypothetical protein